MHYEQVAHFAATYGLIYFIIMFAGVLAYVFWPSNKEKFEEAARLPLEED
ncbi:MAG: cbb3-type cytochrome oxidase subunit 3 [Kiloniellaceae bacterium]